MLHRIYCLPIEDTVLIALFVCLAWTLTGGVLWSRAPWGEGSGGRARSTGCCLALRGTIYHLAFPRPGGV